MKEIQAENSQTIQKLSSGSLAMSIRHFPYL